MRALERRLNALWYGKGSASLLLAPLSNEDHITTKRLEFKAKKSSPKKIKRDKKKKKFFTSK